MHFIIGHVSLNVTSAVFTNVLMIKKMYPLGILGIYIRRSPINVSTHFYATADADKEETILHEKGTIESEYDGDFADGDK